VADTQASRKLEENAACGLINHVSECGVVVVEGSEVRCTRMGLLTMRVRVVRPKMVGSFLRQERGKRVEVGSCVGVEEPCTDGSLPRDSSAIQG
jgi:hypothetical protein